MGQGARATRAHGTDLVNDAARGWCHYSAGECCGSRCLFLRRYVMSAPRRGISTVDGNLWEAGEVLGSHQMGMRCRCGVLAMIWAIDLTSSCRKPTVCPTDHNRGATRAKSARQEPSQGHHPCSCRADYTGLLSSRSLGLQSRRKGARGMGSSSGFQQFGNVELG